MSASIKFGEVQTLIKAYSKQITQRLTKKTKMTKADQSEIDFFQSKIESLMKSFGAYEAAKTLKFTEGDSSAGNRNSRRQSAKKESKSAKKTNEVGPIVDILDQFDDPQFFKYQMESVEATLKHRWTWFLKSRQIGFTYVYAWIMLQLMLKGEDCVWMSASKPQAHVARDYIISFANEVYDIQLKGTDEIRLYKNGKLYSKGMFRGSNAATGQSYSAHLFLDEVFWIPGFEKVERAARGVATHKKWKLVYFSTPSFIDHLAYAKWRGDMDNDLKMGLGMDDGIYRGVITLERACKEGMDEHIDIEQIRKENDDEEYNQLYDCEFLDNSYSKFKWNLLQKCMVDVLEWEDMDISPTGDYIYTGKAPLWMGLDPNYRGQDMAKLVLLTVPDTPKGKYRKVLELEWGETNFRQVVAEIKDLTEQHNIENIAIDCTGGAGSAYAELIGEFFQNVTEVWYTDNVKHEMVNKAKDLVATKRLLFGSHEHHVINAFARIKAEPNANHTKSLIVTERSKKNKDHGDIAWAIMTALYPHELSETQGSSFHFSS